MRLVPALATLALLGPLAAGPLAQDASTDRPDPKPERLIAKERLHAQSPAVTVTRGTAIVGRPLHDAEGTPLGTVHDLLLDDSGHLLALLVARTEGADDALVGLPAELMSVAADEKLLVAERSHELLGAAPELPNAGAVSAPWVVETYEHYGLEEPSLEVPADEHAQGGRGDDDAERPERHVTSLWLARQVIGRPAYSEVDQALGTIEDLALDLAHRRILFVALRATSPDGGGLHAVPFVIPIAQPGGRTVVLDLDAAELELLPTLEGDRWTWPVEA